MESDDLEEIRAALSARVLSCWERLDDAVEELVDVHGVDLAAVLVRVATFREHRP